MAERNVRLVSPWAWAVTGLAVAAVVTTAFAFAAGTPVAPAPPAETAVPTPVRSPVGPLPSPSATPGRAPSPADVPDAPAELKPAKPGEVVQGEDGMRVALTRIEAVTGDAVQPGEVAGPAIRVTVTVTNETKSQFNTSSLVVNAFTGKARKPAGTLVSPGGVPFFGRLAPGESTYGVYLFSIPFDQRDDVTITVDYSTKAAMVVFRGKVG